MVGPSSVAGAHHFSISIVVERGVVHTAALRTVPFDVRISTPFFSFTGSTDITASSSAVAPYNHACFCLDVGSATLAPRLISYPDNRATNADSHAFRAVRNHAYLCLDVASSVISPVVIASSADRVSAPFHVAVVDAVRSGSADICSLSRTDNLENLFSTDRQFSDAVPYMSQLSQPVFDSGAFVQPQNTHTLENLFSTERPSSDVAAYMPQFSQPVFDSGAFVQPQNTDISWLPTIDNLENPFSAGRPSSDDAAYMPQHSHHVFDSAGPAQPQNTPAYMDLGDCDQECRYCGCMFWYGERLKGTDYGRRPEYHLCCGGGRIYMRPSFEPPEFLQKLLGNPHFMDHIRAYNQMFAMTSFGAKVDNTVNVGRGPYVFKISGQIYHWIGALCPELGDPPRFLQLYVYDTRDEVDNRFSNFCSIDHQTLQPSIVQGLVHMLDYVNGLVHLLRTAREILSRHDVLPFKVRLYNKAGSRGYELPTADILGAIVFEDDPNTRTDFDVIIQSRSGPPQRISKLDQSYMSLRYPLLFVYGEPDFFPELVLKPRGGGGRGKKVTMNEFYKYQLHPRRKDFGLIFRSGRLFQQYVVAVFCAVEASRLDYIREKQSDLHSDYLVGLYDVVSRGDRQGIHAGLTIILPRTFTGNPRYMYSHYLDALAICRSLGNPQYFITFTCNVR